MVVISCEQEHHPWRVGVLIALIAKSPPTFFSAASWRFGLAI
jgi:hypothetical protein